MSASETAWERGPDAAEMAAWKVWNEHWKGNTFNLVMEYAKAIRVAEASALRRAAEECEARFGTTGCGDWSFITWLRAEADRAERGEA